MLNMRLSKYQEAMIGIIVLSDPFFLIHTGMHRQSILPVWTVDALNACSWGRYILHNFRATREYVYLKVIGEFCKSNSTYNLLTDGSNT